MSLDTEKAILVNEVIQYLEEIYDDGTDDQRTIIQTGLQWTELLVRKNTDYGSSVWHPPILAPTLDAGSAILVRMSDKIKRISQLTSGADALLKSESLDDTIRDLGAYCLLYLARPKQ